MPSLRYVGPPAAATNDILTKVTTDSGFTAGVSPEVLDQKVSTATSGLVTTSYVDVRDGLLATQSYINQQDALSVPTSTVGAANGVASLDSSGKVPLANIPISSLAYPKVKGPYLFSWAGTIEEASRDSAGAALDKFIGSITIPAPGGSNLWRPLIFGRFEVYNSGGTGRTDIFVTGSGYELARGCGRNGGSAQAYPVTVVPRSDANAQTPGGWSGSTGMTLNFFVSAIFNSTAGGVVAPGSSNAWAFLVRI